MADGVALGESGTGEARSLSLTLLLKLPSPGLESRHANTRAVPLAWGLLLSLLLPDFLPGA